MAIELNENQRKAAYYDGDKYLVIEAGPGAGKTRVLIERIKFLINQKRVDPSTLLVITFTHKAAEELKERLANDIDEATISLMQISTIHAFCRVVLAEIGEFSSRVLGDSVNEKLKMFLNRYKEKLGFVNECHLRQKEISNLIRKYNEYSTFKVDTEKLVKYIEDRCEIGQDYIDFVKEYMDENDGRYPFSEVMHNDSFKQSRNNALYLQIARSYPIYVELLEEKGFIDFAQMQIKTLEYLSENPETHYKNILVDEFQDTDPVQMKIFEILMKHAESFTVVGDIDQSIYGFRGANRNYFEYLYNNYDDNVYKVNLNINYRSTNQIISLSEDYIMPQRAIGAKQDAAIGARDLDRKTYFLVNESSESEAENLFEMIRYMHDNGKIENYNEVAILSRSIRFSNTARELIKLFVDNNIPYHVRGVPDLLDKPEIKSILTLIHHLIDDSDSHSHRFTAWELDWLNLKAYTGKNFNQVLFNLSDETKEILNNLQDDFEIKVMEEEKKAYLKIRNKTSRIESFMGVFKRDGEVLTEMFRHLERPVLSDENLIRYGVKNEDDLKFFRKLNSLKEYINSKEYLDSEDTILDIYIKLLTDVCNYLDEDFINDEDNEKVLENLAIISNTFYNYEIIDNNKDLRGVYLFLTFNIGGYSTNQDESEGVQLMTVHKSKGLEFPVVILLSLNEMKFPKEYKERHDRFFTPNSCLDYKNLDGEEEIQEYIEEEDRIVYVAMTRAQDILILSNLIKKNDEFEELKDKLKEELSEIEKREILMEIPKGHEKIHELINRNIFDCVFLEDDYSKIPKTVCEKPETKREDFLNLSFSSLEDYIECPFKYKLLHHIHFAESTVEYNKLRGLFVHNLLETVNNRIKSNGNKYIGDEEVLAIFEKFKNSFHFENLRLSNDEFNTIRNDILYYYHTFGKDFNILKTEHSFKIDKEFYQLSGIVDLIYRTDDGKIGILDYKNTELISYHYVKNYIKQIYTYIIGLKNSLEIKTLRIYAVKARKMIDIELNQESLDILLEELDTISQNIGNEIFECNRGEDCFNCGFSNICIGANRDGTSVFDFNRESTWNFRNKFYQHLPVYQIIDLRDMYWKDLDFTDNLNSLQNNPSSIENKCLKSENYDDINLDDSDTFKNNKKSDGKKDILSKFDSIDTDDSNGIEIKAGQKDYGNKLLKSKDYDDAEDFYKKLITNKYYLNDYYPFRKLATVYQKKKEYGNVINVIDEFFKSERYCSESQLLWFKLKYKKACRYTGRHFSNFDVGLNYFKEHGLKNKDKQNKPVPIAARLQTGRKKVKIISQESHDKKSEYTELKLKYKFADKYGSSKLALNYYEQLWNRHEFTKNLTAYKKLCSLYEDNEQYSKVIEVAEEYFKSNARKTKSSPGWFDKKIEKANKKLDRSPQVSSKIGEISNEKPFNGNPSELDIPNKSDENHLDVPFITIACSNLTKLLKRNCGEIIIIQYRGDKIRLEIVDTGSHRQIYEELTEKNLSLTVVKENFKVLRSLSNGELITIKCKGRFQEVLLKVVN